MTDHGGHYHRIFFTSRCAQRANQGRQLWLNYGDLYLLFWVWDFRANQWKSSCPELKTDAVSFTKSQITKCQSPWLLSPSASTRPAIMIEKNLPSDRRNGLSGVPLTEMHWRVFRGAVKITAPRYQLSAIGSCQNDPKAILSAIGASFPALDLLASAVWQMAGFSLRHSKASPLSVELTEGMNLVAPPGSQQLQLPAWKVKRTL